MQYHLFLTEQCNLNCTYCGWPMRLSFLPVEHTYPLNALQTFLSKDPDATIGFYGGEPLLAMDFLEEIMTTIPAKAFTLQTNGTLLTELKDEYLHRLHSILVSIDGNAVRTDACRGTGTYATILRNLRSIRQRGYRGDVVARMTVSKNAEVYDDVMHLLSLRNPHFGHVHWQLDLFWSELDSWCDLEGWLRNYEHGISRLVKTFAAALEERRVLGLVPFIAVLNTLITREPVPHIRCGAGMDSFAILTSGNIEVCPIAPELPYSNVGTIFTTDPDTIRNALPVDGPCAMCDIRWVCGGRCLYANQTMSWGREWFDRTCKTTRHMITELDRLVPRIKELMADGTLPNDAFNYPEINNGCEIIP